MERQTSKYFSIKSYFLLKRTLGHITPTWSSAPDEEASVPELSERPRGTGRVWDSGGVGGERSVHCQPPGSRSWTSSFQGPASLLYPSWLTVVTPTYRFSFSWRPLEVGCLRSSTELWREHASRNFPTGGYAHSRASLVFCAPSPSS